MDAAGPKMFQAIRIDRRAESHLSSPTHRFATHLAGIKLADLNGDTVSQFTSKWLGPQDN